jgi:16S rRNA (guanine527-N7)-methyltransferase
MKANNQESVKALEEFKESLDEALSNLHTLTLTDEQVNQLVGHYAMMMEWNRHINLTRITEPGEAARLHYAESLFGARFLNKAQKVLDIGSGAGFPGVPLAVACPEIEVTALESNQKKALFLAEVKDALQIRNFKILRARIEDLAPDQFDLLTSRALDRAEEIMPKVLKKMSPQQRLMLYCAPEMIDYLKQQLTADYQIESAQIPFARSRLIALFSRRQA